MNDRLTALLTATLFLFAACSAGPASTPTASPTVVATPSPSPTLAPTPTPTSSPSPTPTASPTAEPLSAVDILMSYAEPGLKSTCQLSEQLYDDELASVTCGLENLPFDYSLFGSSEEMRAAYNNDVAGAETPPQPDGTCPQGNYESTYLIDGQVVGRVNCREHVSTTSGAPFHVLEWTHDELLVIGYISNRADLHSWDELISFWRDHAGPFVP